LTELARNQVGICERGHDAGEVNVAATELNAGSLGESHDRSFVRSVVEAARNRGLSGAGCDVHDVTMPLGEHARQSQSHTQRRSKYVDLHRPPDDSFWDLEEMAYRHYACVVDEDVETPIVCFARSRMTRTIPRR
jgi:hypothetical protein